MAELDKIRWQCRRGMLELDLILEKFNQHHLANLGPDQLERYKQLLAFPDNELLDLVMARVSLPDQGCDKVLQLLRAA